MTHARRFCSNSQMTFALKYDVELVVEDLGRVQDIRTPMITAAPAGEGPDIFIGVHDWLGAMVESGLVAPIDLGDKEDEFVPLALEAFTYTDGQLYGLPYATENLGFFYNTELVTEPPTTWDEVLEMGRDLKAEGKVQNATALPWQVVVTMPCRSRRHLAAISLARMTNGAWNARRCGPG